MPDQALEIVSYISQASSNPSEEDLQELLRAARIANRANQITGSLIYRNGSFIQAFEGPADQVEALYSKIKADPRHREIVQLFRRPIKQRYFKTWKMAYKRLSDLEFEEAAAFAATLRSSPTHNQETVPQVLGWLCALVSDYMEPALD